jgi:endonuclease/exonuclease/phosphatase family metal-dependent hydrolase
VGSTDRPVDRSGPLRPDVAGGRATLTLATFNVHMGVDGWGRPYDLIGQCRSLHADILIMQESFAPADGSPSTAERVAAELGYDVVAEVALAGVRVSDRSPSTSKRWAPWPSLLRTAFHVERERRSTGAKPHRPGSRRGRLGVAMLSRLPVDDVAVLHLNQLRRDPARRVVISCTTTLGGRSVSIFGTHMSHISHGSHAQYRQLRAQLPHPDVAAVLAGDMNLWGPPVNSFFPAWRRAVTGRTWPSKHPHSQVDHVLITPPLSVVDGRVVERSGSDHRPVVVTLALA